MCADPMLNAKPVTRKCSATPRIAVPEAIVRRIWLILFVVFGFAVGPAETRGVEIGNPAPKWAIRDWIQGSPVDWEKPGDTNLYVLEFWATWCGPCRVTMPHLNAIQQRYQNQGVVVLGLSAEEPEVVRTYLKQAVTNVSYRIALDAAGATTERYFQAFSVSGIPHAFVIGRGGKVLWEGHPMMGLEETLQQLLDGSYDLKAARSSSEFLKDYQQYYSIEATVGSTPESKRLGLKMLEDAADQPILLHRLASVVLNDPRIRKRDVALALAAAKASLVGAGARNPIFLQTFAQAQFASGEREAAIRTQTAAVELVQSPDQRRTFQTQLDEFTKKAGAYK